MDIAGSMLVCGRMRAITVQQPYASALVSGTRTVELRSFTTSTAGGIWLCVHAGKSSRTLTASALSSVQSLWPNMPSKRNLQEQTGKILGFIYVSHIYDVEHPKVRDDPWLKQALTIRSKAASGASDDAEKSGVYAWVIDKAVPLREAVTMPRGQLRVWWVSASLSQQLKRSLQSALTSPSPASDHHAEQRRNTPDSAAANRGAAVSSAPTHSTNTFSPPGAAIMQSSAVLQPFPLVPLAGGAVPAADPSVPPQLQTHGAARAQFNLANSPPPAGAPARPGSIFGLLAQALNGRPPPVQGWSSPPAEHHVFVVTPGASAGAPSSITSHSHGPRSHATAGVPDVTVLVADNAVKLGRDPAGSPPLLQVGDDASRDASEGGGASRDAGAVPQLASGAAVQLPNQGAAAQQLPQPSTRLLQSAPRDFFGSSASSNAAAQPTQEQQDRSDFSLLQGARAHGGGAQWAATTKRPRDEQVQPLEMDAQDSRFKVPRSGSECSPSPGEGGDAEGGFGSSSNSRNSASDPAGSQYTAGSSKQTTAERRACGERAQSAGGAAGAGGKHNAAVNGAGKGEQHSGVKGRHGKSAPQSGDAAVHVQASREKDHKSAFEMSQNRSDRQQTIAEL